MAGRDHAGDDGCEEPEACPDIAELRWPTKIEHPDQFVRELSEITSLWFAAHGRIPVRPWFRGVTRISHSLEPSLLRYRPRSLRLAEDRMMNQFRLLGSRFLDAQPENRLELFTIMQHHGMPTRLLDWSENAFAALYFAVREAECFGDPEDAVVWVLDPLRLTEIQTGQKAIRFSEEKLLDLDAQQPLPFYPVHKSSRVTPQRSAFTVHPFSPQHALVKIAVQENQSGRLPPLFAIQIRADRRAVIRDAMINVFGSGEFAFFPDLDGLARELRMREGFEGDG
jgi:hypothetical protein